jgi:hypothetical protein
LPWELTGISPTQGANGAAEGKIWFGHLLPLNYLVWLAAGVRKLTMSLALPLPSAHAANPKAMCDTHTATNTMQPLGHDQTCLQQWRYHAFSTCSCSVPQTSNRMHNPLVGRAAGINATAATTTAATVATTATAVAVVPVAIIRAAAVKQQ